MYIFISGFGHSGTTLMSVILGAHSQTHLIPYETRWFLWGECNDSEAIAYSHSISFEYIIEKTPMHVRRISQMSEIFPDAKFIVMVRNPLDVIASQYKRHGKMERAINRLQKDYASIANVQHMECVKIVRYEDMVENPQGVIKDVCEFVGLLFEPEMLEYHKQDIRWEGVEPEYTDGVGEEEHLKRRAWQVTQPIFDGRGRWRRELNDEEVKTILENVENVCEELAYKV
jgi:protein O-GlcNAc transferase